MGGRSGGGGSGWGVRVDGNGEVKLVCKFEKKKMGGLGSGGESGQGGCEWRSVAFVKIPPPKFFFWGGGGGGGSGQGVGLGGVRVDGNGELKLL